MHIPQKLKVDIKPSACFYVKTDLLADFKSAVVNLK